QFGLPPSRIDLAKRWMAACYERAYSERDKTESGSYAQEYLNYFLNQEPSPGIEYEFRLVQQLLPGISLDDVTTLARLRLAGDDRVVLAVTPQKDGVRVPTESDLQNAIGESDYVAITASNDRTTHAARHD